MSLIRSRLFINGQWRDSDGRKSMVVLNPADGSVVAEVADATKGDIDAAVSSAADAYSGWRSRTTYDRCTLLTKWYELIMQNRTELAEIMTLEQGKPLKEAKGEITYAASFVKWFAEEGVRAYGETIPAPAPNSRFVAIRQAVGPVAIITPWNFPSAMITRKAAPALAAGCTLVAKPSEETPLSALALAALAESAGFPAGVFNVVNCSNPQEFSDVVFSDQRIEKLSFTGSTPVGKKMMKASSATLKKVSLELGGNAPFIVFNDADIDKALKGLMTAKFRNGGQACIAANRIFVHKDVMDAFCDKLFNKMKNLKLGPGIKNDTDIGPQINKKAVSKLSRLVNNAMQNGATLKLGGNAIEDCYFEPTLLLNCSDDMEVFKEEIFGPVAAIYSFESEKEVIQRANNTPHGLASYFYSKDVSRCWRVAEALECGMVGINSGFISDASAPFGGVKESGIGREGSRHGLNEYLELKYMSFGIG
ncbi:MAG: NAD-dependent succinate-semialdehyde dehydrogenase [Saprospirales bacterium]|nr:MAG: NAD-dependent succinate-semialdehyde dehydrogenase [Saprospirales bacterium]